MMNEMNAQKLEPKTEEFRRRCLDTVTADTIGDMVRVRMFDREDEERIQARLNIGTPMKELPGGYVLFPVVSFASEDGEGVFSASMPTEKLCGMSEQEIFAKGVENMGEPRLVNMSEATFGEGATDLFDDPAHEFEGMGVLGFGDGAFGSAAIAIDGILDKIADRIGGSYWLIPSSIHELLVLADNDSFDAPTLNRMIRDANEVVCEPGDVLSWNARYYDKDTKTLSVM